MDETIEKFPDLIPKLEQFLGAELERKSRLYNLAYRLLIGTTRDPQRRAALMVQKVTNYYPFRQSVRRSMRTPCVVEMTRHCAPCHVQAWTQFSTMKARSESMFTQGDLSAQQVGTKTQRLRRASVTRAHSGNVVAVPAPEGSLLAMDTAIREIQSQMTAMRREMRVQIMDVAERVSAGPASSKKPIATQLEKPRYRSGVEA